MSVQTTSAKTCVNCGTDVTRGKRMKDSSGHYWCVACGSADQFKKHGSSSQSQCPMCGNMYPPSDAHRLGEKYVCSSCAKQVGEAGKLAGSAQLKSDQKKKLIIGAVLLVFGVGLIYAHFTGLMDELLY
jgi:predicted RNA-binding Zn-ribbon protein involved in translation (DUF1610 family)